MRFDFKILNLVPILAAPSIALAADQPPFAQPFERYAPMLARSPFALATEPAPAAPADTAGFAKDLVLTGAVRMGSGEYVTIASRDQSQRFGLMAGETYNGITLVSIAWSEAAGKTRATLKRGTEYAVICFDEAAVRSGPAAPTPALSGNQSPAAAPAGAGNASGQPTLPPGAVAPKSSPGFMAPPGSNPPANTAGRPLQPRLIRSTPPSP